MPQAPLTARMAQAGADDRTLRRAIIEQLLSDNLGTKVANEPKFQQIVARVTEMIEEDPELGTMLAAVVTEVRR